MKLKSFLKSPALLLAAAVLLLAGGTVGSARAALSLRSDNLQINIETAALSVALVEGEGKDAVIIEDGGKLLTNLLGENESFKIGKTYEETISAANDGSYEEYVRVIVTKSWMNADGTKDTSLDPSLIELGVKDGWVVDEQASTKEQTVYYYTRPVAPGEVVALTDSLTVSNEVTSVVTKTGTTGNITTTYDYTGKSFSVEAEVDAVQTHSAKDAIYGAWGVNVNIDSDGNLSLE